MEYTIQTLIDDLQALIRNGAPANTKVMVNDSRHGIQCAESVDHISVSCDQIVLIEGAHHDL